VIALAGGSFLSKPSEASFKDMIRKKMETPQKDDLISVIFKSKSDADKFLEKCHYKDRIFWATVEKDGKTVYTGAFATWFAGDLKAEAAAAK
jgi:hypothetical protein